MTGILLVCLSVSDVSGVPKSPLQEDGCIFYIIHFRRKKSLMVRSQYKNPRKKNKNTPETGINAPEKLDYYFFYAENPHKNPVFQTFCEEGFLLCISDSSKVMFCHKKNRRACSRCRRKNLSHVGGKAPPISPPEVRAAAFLNAEYEGEKLESACQTGMISGLRKTRIHETRLPDIP